MLAGLESAWGLGLLSRLDLTRGNGCGSCAEALTSTQVVELSVHFFLKGLDLVLKTLLNCVQILRVVLTLNASLLVTDCTVLIQFLDVEVVVLLVELYPVVLLVLLFHLVLLRF